MTTRLLLPAVLLALLVPLLAACGGGNGDGSTPTATADPGATFEPAATVEPAATEPPSAAGVELTWWGQAMFVLVAADGTRVLIDPYREIGYRVPDSGELAADVVTVSHEHPDHNNVILGGAAQLLRGLTPDAWAAIDERPSAGLRIISVAAFHDDSEAAEFGRNAIFVYETGGLRIVHLGDYGQATLTQEQLDAIGPVDVLLVPAGGVFTVDAVGATAVVDQLAPRITIPMHYKTEALTIGLEPVDAFLADKEVVEQGDTVSLDPAELPAAGSGLVWLLTPAGAE